MIYKIVLNKSALYIATFGGRCGSEGACPVFKRCQCRPYCFLQVKNWLGLLCWRPMKASGVSGVFSITQQYGALAKFRYPDQVTAPPNNPPPPMRRPRISQPHTPALYVWAPQAVPQGCARICLLCHGAALRSSTPPRCDVDCRRLPTVETAVERVEGRTRPPSLGSWPIGIPQCTGAPLPSHSPKAPPSSPAPPRHTENRNGPEWSRRAGRRPREGRGAASSCRPDFRKKSQTRLHPASGASSLWG